MIGSITKKYEYQDSSSSGRYEILSKGGYSLSDAEDFHTETF